MSALDYVVLIGSMLGIAVYGIWRTRDARTQYIPQGRWQHGLVRHRSFRHGHSGQRHHVSFDAGPGIPGGLGFVQNYFGVPLALIIIAAVFLPIFRRLNVYTAYEYLGSALTARPAAWCGLVSSPARTGAGITFMRPPLFFPLSSAGRSNLTIICSGLVVIVYTVTGGSGAVTVTQKYQMAVIFAGMVTAFCMLVAQIARRTYFHRCPDPGRRISQTQCGEFFTRRSRALHVLVGIARRNIPDAGLFRHRSIPGAALYFRRLIARRPARPDVQRRLQNPDAVLHLAARCADFCLLSIRTAAVVFQCDFKPVSRGTSL